MSRPSVGLHVLVYAFCAYLNACPHARARTIMHVTIRRSSVTAVSMLRAERRRSRGLISGWPERENVLVPWLGLGTPLVSCGVVTGVFSPWSGREADLLPQSVVQVKNTWSCTSTPLICIYPVLLNTAQGQATFTLTLYNCNIMVEGVSRGFHNAAGSCPVNSTCMGSEIRLEYAAEGRNRWNTDTFVGSHIDAKWDKINLKIM